ncbi:MAG TPA: DUF2383 domain-containing protein [Tepidisphaeraceae bacterium]|nr:DUF2383 domain-containing protein [Tepidisphaeraceae bacterium]
MAVNFTPSPAPDDAPSGAMDDVVRQLNSLLRGEIASVETYKMAIDKVAASDPAAAEAAGLLREVQDAHGRAAQTLRDRILELGGEPSDSSGAWGTWATTVQGTLSLFGGDRGALKALKEGEEHGLKDYQEAVDDVDPTTRTVIQNQLLPAQQRHVGVIDRLIGTVSDA